MSNRWRDEISHQSFGSTPVPGGWLVWRKAGGSLSDSAPALTSCYIADPKQWAAALAEALGPVIAKKLDEALAHDRFVRDGE